MKLPTILVSNKNAWKVEGKLRASYWVTRNKNKWYCACPARCLCRHIKAVVKANAVREGWDSVQFCNYQEQEKMTRQKRRTVEMVAHGKPFWVVYASEWARAEVPEGSRFAGVKRDRWFAGRFDVYFWQDGFLARIPVRRA